MLSECDAVQAVVRPNIQPCARLVSVALIDFALCILNAGHRLRHGLPVQPQLDCDWLVSVAIFLVGRCDWHSPVYSLFAPAGLRCWLV